MSIIQEHDFLSNLYAIQSLNPPSYVLFPGTKTFYDIDLNAREITAPEHLSVSKDHQSETIYFRINRFHDYMDLSNTTCVIQYVTPDQKAHLYAVPFYDIVTEKRDNKMIIPWCVDGNVTKFKGVINFSIRFFIVEQKVSMKEEINDEGNTTQTEVVEYNLIYNLTTTPAQSKVLDGMEVSDLESDLDISATQYDYLLGLINNIKREGVYWDILD